MMPPRGGARNIFKGGFLFKILGQKINTNDNLSN